MSGCSDDEATGNKALREHLSKCAGLGERPRPFKCCEKTEKKPEPCGEKPAKSNCTSCKPEPKTERVMLIPYEPKVVVPPTATFKCPTSDCCPPKKEEPKCCPPKEEPKCCPPPKPTCPCPPPEPKCCPPKEEPKCCPPPQPKCPPPEPKCPPPESKCPPPEPKCPPPEPICPCPAPEPSCPSEPPKENCGGNGNDNSCTTRPLKM